MDLENRYLVIKHTDIDAADLTEEEWDALFKIAAKVTKHREKRGAGILNALVIEKDWPEYRPALRSLARRVDRQERPDKVYLPAWWALLAGAVLWGLIVVMVLKISG